MTLYNYLFSTPPVTVAEYMELMAAGEFIKNKKTGKEILEDLSKLFPRSQVPKPHFDRASVRAKTIEDLFHSALINRKDLATGQEVPFVYRQKIKETNTYHDYKSSIDAFLFSAKRSGIINPYRELMAYRTTLGNECILHYCYFYDIISKIPIEILEEEPSLIHYYMIMMNAFITSGNTRESGLIKETILYLLSTSKVFREQKDVVGNYALNYCSDLEVACKYMLLAPEIVEERNKYGINILLSSFITRDIRLLVINFKPSIIYQTIKLDNSLNPGTEYLFYSINDSFILRYIIDIILGPAKESSNGDFLLNTDTSNTIFNTSKCFDALLYLTSLIKKDIMIDYVRNHKECYNVLFSSKIKVIGISDDLTPRIDYINLDGHKKDSSFIELEKLFNDYITNDIYE